MKKKCNNHKLDEEMIAAGFPGCYPCEDCGHSTHCESCKSTYLKRKEREEKQNNTGVKQTP